MWIECFVLCYLGVLVLLDAKNRELPIRILAVGTVLSIAVAGYRIIAGGGSWTGLFLGAVPGLILINLSWLTRSAGLGDGLVLLQLDLCLLPENLIVCFAISLLAIGAFAFLMLLVGRGKKDLRLPYMPFLWLGCLAGWILCG